MLSRQGWMTQVFGCRWRLYIGCQSFLVGARPASGGAEPGGRSQPDAPGSKTLIADWDDSRCAVTKADGKEMTNEIAQDSQFSPTLDKVATGAVVMLTVTARNSAGESPASNAVEIAVPQERPSDAEILLFMKAKYLFTPYWEFYFLSLSPQPAIPLGLWLGGTGFRHAARVRMDGVLTDPK